MMSVFVERLKMIVRGIDVVRKRHRFAIYGTTWLMIVGPVCIRESLHKSVQVPDGGGGLVPAMDPPMGEHDPQLLVTM